MQYKSLLRPLMLVTWMGLSSCASPPPVLPPASAQNTTEEGLVRVENTRFDAVFVRPGFSLANFDSVLLSPVSISYKSSRPENELNEKQLELMQHYFTEELESVFGEGGLYTIVDTANAGTMSIHARIVDLEIDVPTDQPDIHRNAVFVASSGRMTLEADVFDAKTGDLLVRVADRRQARDRWHKATRVSEWSEVRAAFRYWASIARDRIEAAHADRF